MNVSENCFTLILLSSVLKEDTVDKLRANNSVLLVFGQTFLKLLTCLFAELSRDLIHSYKGKKGDRDKIANFILFFSYILDTCKQASMSLL